MNRAFALPVALLACGLTACSIPTVVKRGEPFELNKPVLVEMRSGAEFPAASLHVTDDTVVIVRNDRAERRIPVEKVNGVVEMDRVGGFVRGAGNGFWAGVGTGFLIGVIGDASCEGEGCGYISLTAIFPVLGAIIGTPLGALAGLAEGHGARYRFDTPHASSRAVTGAAEPGDSTRSSAYTPPTGAAAFHEDARYPSHAERRRRAEALKAARNALSTDVAVSDAATSSRSGLETQPPEWRFGADVGTTGLFHGISSGARSDAFGTFEVGYASLWANRGLTGVWEGGVRLVGGIGRREGERFREVGLLGDLTRSLGDRGAFARMGFGLADYALEMSTQSSSTGFAATLGIGQTLFASENARARASLELWGSAYDDGTKSATVKVLAGFDFK